MSAEAEAAHSGSTSAPRPMSLYRDDLQIDLKEDRVVDPVHPVPQVLQVVSHTLGPTLLYLEQLDQGEEDDEDEGEVGVQAHLRHLLL